MKYAMNKVGSIMDNDQKTRQSISELVDGEVEPQQIASLMGSLREEAHRKTWDSYQQIGELIRNEAAALSLSRDFDERMRQRLAAEPTQLAPRRGLARLAAWPTALAALAAASLGFFVVPSFFHSDQTMPVLPSSVVQDQAVGHDQLLADASHSVPSIHAAAFDYIRLHQGSNPSLYRDARPVRPAHADLEPRP